MLSPPTLTTGEHVGSWIDRDVEDDQLFPDDIRAEGQKILVDNNIPHEIQVFPGVPHGQYLDAQQVGASADARTGFAVVGEYDDPKIMDAQKAAFEQMLSWLKSH